jgi:hypothetical protein
VCPDQVHAYQEKISRWWAAGTGTGNDNGTTTGTSLQASVVHGTLWSTERYAELIHMYAGDGDVHVAATAMASSSGSSSGSSGVSAQYAQALRRSGVTDVCNGFVFCRTVETPPSNTEPTVVCHIHSSHEQVWQAVAGACGESVRASTRAAIIRSIE